MKLSEIEAHVYLKKAVEPKLARVFEEPEEIKFIDYPVYTAEQMQEYAKAQVYEALYKHTSFGTGKEELVKHMTEEFFAENIFEEDTKNEKIY